MKPITRTLAAVTAAGVTSLAGIAAALAGPVTPLVVNSTATVISAGNVPIGITDFAADAQPTSVSVTSSTTNVPPPPGGGVGETTAGAAAVTVDVSDINASVVRSRSEVSTTRTSPATETQNMFHGSIAGFNASLATDGLSPGGAATVDLVLNVSGRLIYSDPNRTANTVVDPDFGIAVSDLAASVSVILALAAPVTIPPDPAEPPDPLPLVPLFNGSATLRSPTTAGLAPDLVLEGDWRGHAGDFTSPGTCDAAHCEVNVSTMLLFPDVQSLGFDQMFDIGLLLLTNADSTSDQQRMAASLFFDSASVSVRLTALAAPVPEPGTLSLLALALAGLALARRRGLL